jgi:hypothetical protein
MHSHVRFIDTHTKYDRYEQIQISNEYATYNHCSQPVCTFTGVEAGKGGYKCHLSDHAADKLPIIMLERLGKKSQ